MAQAVITTNDIASYVNSVRSATKWMLSIQNPDGSINPADKGPLTYYKVPRGLAITGHLDEADRLLDWARREIFTSEGDFKAQRAGFHQAHYTYSSCWFVWAAQTIGRFDMSYPGMDYLQRFRHPGTGGYCSEATYGSGNNEQDLLSTAFTSFVGLYFGRVKEAKAAARWIDDLLAQQPEVGKRLWLRKDDGGKLLTAVPAGCAEPRYYLLELPAPQQYYYYLGAGIVFLAKLYTITGQKRHLRTAHKIFKIASGCHPDVFLTDGTGKVGLGSSYLYQITGKREYAEAARKSCEFLVRDQQPDGYWERGGKPTASSTAEFVVWLKEILAVFHGQDA
ncbi:MAG: hypothetical protein ABSB63_21585 [Spirochaetia bacterium]|jgi:hypothetical protein